MNDIKIIVSGVIKKEETSYEYNDRDTSIEYSIGNFIIAKGNYKYIRSDLDKYIGKNVTLLIISQE